VSASYGCEQNGTYTHRLGLSYCGGNRQCLRVSSPGAAQPLLSFCLSFVFCRLTVKVNRLTPFIGCSSSPFTTDNLRLTPPANLVTVQTAEGLVGASRLGRTSERLGNPCTPGTSSYAGPVCISPAGFPCSERESALIVNYLGGVVSWESLGQDG
jgi:hypothetical protein